MLAWRGAFRFFRSPNATAANAGKDCHTVWLQSSGPLRALESASSSSGDPVLVRLVPEETRFRCSDDRFAPWLAGSAQSGARDGPDPPMRVRIDVRWAGIDINRIRATGSTTPAKTIGIVRVCRWRATVAGVEPIITMISGRRPTNSCATAPHAADLLRARRERPRRRAAEPSDEVALQAIPHVKRIVRKARLARASWTIHGYPRPPSSAASAA